jgi:plastocyanin
VVDPAQRRFLGSAPILTSLPALEDHEEVDVSRPLKLALLLLAACAASAPLRAETGQIEVTLQNDAFAPAEVKAPAGRPFVMKFVNKGAAAAEIEAKDLKVEKVVAGNSEIVVRVPAMKPGRYLFVNEYKEETVKGYVVVE